MRITWFRVFVLVVAVAATAFLGWRMVRPMNISAVSPSIERPMSTAKLPEGIESLSANECAGCHQEFFDEWKTTIHSQAWTDPYYQVDLKFDGSQQICLNCHIPLDRQQENLVLGFRDKDKWDPILAPNPDFDYELQQEGVTCAACHLKEGKILGPRGSKSAPHPVEKIQSGNQICVRCHVVKNEGWDVFFRFPPCGTVAEINTSNKQTFARGPSGELSVGEIEGLGCVDCHMPLTQRPVADGFKSKQVRQHLWRGGHDPKMVSGALSVSLVEQSSPASKKRNFALTLTNTGAAHYLPTGTPDRHLVATFRLLDNKGALIDEEKHTLKRTIMWRPFIIDLWDSRLPRGQPRTFDYSFSNNNNPRAETLEVVVEYFLVDEARRKRIGYDDKDATHYEVFSQRLKLVP